MNKKLIISALLTLYACSVTLLQAGKKNKGTSRIENKENIDAVFAMFEKKVKKEKQDIINQDELQQLFMLVEKDKVTEITNILKKDSAILYRTTELSELISLCSL